jgi:hypothetical protein
MVQTLIEQPHVTFEAVDASVFFDYGELLDNFYKPVPVGQFRNDKVVSREDREQQLKQLPLQPVTALGLKPIKQVELYTKWRKFVPAEFVDEICPKPHDDILKKVQEARSEKNRERNAKKLDQ